jgi:hypothetical protein
MAKMRLMVVTVVASGLMACGGDDAKVRTVTVTGAAEATATSAPLSGIPVLIETKVIDARRHRGKVVDGSVLGETPFCKGGTSSGGSEGATITSTFKCPGGTLKVQYAPTQRSAVQSSQWTVVSGTGDYEGLTGGGFMVASFVGDNPDVGREVFTGDVGE